MRGYPGETIGAALLASGVRGFRRDSRGALRGPYCNMGTCFECLVEVREASGLDSDAEGGAGGSWRLVRACLTAVSADLHVRSRSFIRTLEDKE